jgi:hypothetical protein
MKCLLFILLLVSPAWGLAGQLRVMPLLSPKLREFLGAHPLAAKELDQVITEDFAHRSVQVYYFYTDDETAARAFHYCPTTNAVVFCVRENQNQVDEFLCILFEMLNTKKDPEFRMLQNMVRLRGISRTNYARDMIKVEFATLQEEKTIINNLHFSNPEIAQSATYRHFMDSPSKFDDFLANSKKLANRDVVKQYEDQYDSLQGTDAKN